MSQDARQMLGMRGEELACEELRRRGYAILARRYRTRLGELDIVARDGETVVFVEVKARRSDRFGNPAEAVTWRKRQKLRQMAEDFLLRASLSSVPCRFDVVSVALDEGGAPARIDVFSSAFRADGW